MPQVTKILYGWEKRNDRLKGLTIFNKFDEKIFLK